MAPRLSGQNSIFGVVFFVSKSLLGIERQKKLEKFAILTRKPRSHARILIYRTWPITGRVILELCLKKPRSGKARDCSSKRKRKAGVFKFLWFDERVRKAPLSQRIGIDGGPNRRIKPSFLNSSDEVWTSP